MPVAWNVDVEAVYFYEEAFEEADDEVRSLARFMEVIRKISAITYWTSTWFYKDRMEFKGVAKSSEELKDRLAKMGFKIRDLGNGEKYISGEADNWTVNFKERDGRA